MQTFLPYPDFAESAKVLDDKRLGKQRIEVLTLIRGGWKNHPASKMWRGYEYFLGSYGLFICVEWIERGYKDSCLDKIFKETIKFPKTDPPKWLGNKDFHLSHQSNLLRKNSAHYAKYFVGVPENLPYIWP